MMTATIVDQYVEVDGIKLHYQTAGQGEAVLLLHGWPTSAYLWRNIIAPLAQTKQVIALDLPGFGQSDKPLKASYSFGFYERTLDAFLTKIGVTQVDLVVHDLGGPVGLIWAVRHPEKVRRLALLNTLVYPQLSWASVGFLVMVWLPFMSTRLASPRGIKSAMRLGVEKRLAPEVVQAYQSPFETLDAQKVLLKSVRHLSVAGLREIAEKLPRFTVPVALIYGAKDRILPDVATTMARVKRDLPQAQVHVLAEAGHFLQEDEPEQISALLATFLNS